MSNYTNFNYHPNGTDYIKKRLNETSHVDTFHQKLFQVRSTGYFSRRLSLNWKVSGGAFHDLAAGTLLKLLNDCLFRHCTESHGVRTFHPEDISPQDISPRYISPLGHFTPRTFHPTYVSPHFLKNEYNEPSGMRRKNNYCVIDV